MATVCLCVVIIFLVCAVVNLHMLQKEDTDWVKKCMEYKVDGARPRDRPNRIWREVVEKDCQSRKLNKEDAMDCSRWFCSLAVLDPRVGHTMDIFSPFISVFCHSDRLFHGESWLRLDFVHPGRAWPSSPACTWHCSLHYLFLQATPLFPHSVTIVCASFLAPTHMFSFCPRNPSFHLKGTKACFFMLSESPAFTAIHCYRPH